MMDAYYDYPPECLREIARLQNELRKWEKKTKKLEDKLKKETEEKESLDFRVRTELEPRLKAEECSYDRWVTNDPAPEAEDHWQSLLSEMIDRVEENPAWFDWEDGVGEIDEKILYVIKHRNCKVISESDYDILQNAR